MKEATSREMFTIVTLGDIDADQAQAVFDYLCDTIPMCRDALSISRDCPNNPWIALKKNEKSWEGWYVKLSVTYRQHTRTAEHVQHCAKDFIAGFNFAETFFRKRII